VCPAGAFLATSFTLGRKDNLHKVLLWIHEHTVAGLAIFGLLYVWFTVMFLPPALLAACAGALYGFLLAIPIVWACAVVSEAITMQQWLAAAAAMQSLHMRGCSSRCLLVVSCKLAFRQTGWWTR
jgi:uncharacterized membrane protein YdjX (TVP38/TMEM64 family)